jgi:hypothetical protein
MAPWAVAMAACVVAAIGLWTAVAGQEGDSTEGQGSPALEGRFAVTSEVGGAVWAFLPGGLLTLIGPGDLVAQGTWSWADPPDTVDAAIDIDLTGQELGVLGALAPDGRRIALYVRASEPRTPENGVPWPLEARLVGERVGIVEVDPSPASTVPECLRPVWESDSVVDWEPCQPGAAATLEALHVPEPSVAPDESPDPGA